MASRPDPPRTTWDGLPISPVPPYGASVLVWREAGDGSAWLLLHRAHHGTDYAGDWAWTPPSGSRLPGEAVRDCAERELREETGLVLPLLETRLGSADWAVYAAEAPAGAAVRLDAEHDRFEWVRLDEAASRCLPSFVGQSFRSVAALAGPAAGPPAAS